MGSLVRIKNGLGGSILPGCCRRRCRLIADSASVRVGCRGCFERSSACRSTTDPTRPWLMKAESPFYWRWRRLDGSPPAFPRYSAFSEDSAAGLGWELSAAVDRRGRIQPNDRNAEAMPMYYRRCRVRGCACCYRHRFALFRPTRYRNRSNRHADCWGTEPDDDGDEVNGGNQMW